MKNFRLLLAGAVLIIAAGGAYAKGAFSAHNTSSRAMAWFEYSPTTSGGTANPANYHEITSTGCLNGSQLCAIRVEKNASTGLPDATALNNIQSDIDAGTPIAGKVVFKP
ncbi:hypothetical protein ACE38W_17510 [Chitinophaga sp. Hz27]|uniref:hypothetical protein n=1 Tax=Chitinophaga sp. Hz27 TaxID=3347169 RepID=UPI0035D6AE72